ncbi:unnamed protein product [Prunus armeniaca]
MEKTSYVKVLELQKASCLHAQVGKVSPSNMEWKKMKENGSGWLDKIECSSTYKMRHFLPSKDNGSKASIPHGTLQFHALFFHILPLSPKTHIQREQVSPLILGTLQFPTLFFHLFPFLLWQTLPEQATSLLIAGSFNFMLCSSIFFLSLP